MRITFLVLAVVASAVAYIYFWIVSGSDDALSLFSRHQSNNGYRKFKLIGDAAPPLCNSKGEPLPQTPPAPSLNDKTITLSPCIHRPWLYEKEYGTLGDFDAVKPPYKLLLTSFKWNSIDNGTAINNIRSIRSRELLQSIVDHPYFDPEGWEDYESGRRPIDPSVRYYVFLDVETCFEGNYPNYGAALKTNLDGLGGRVVPEAGINPGGDCYIIRHCGFINSVFQSPLFQNPKVHSHLVYFECRGAGVVDSYRANEQPSTKLAIVSTSSGTNQLLASIDQGQQPPVALEITLNPEEIENIETCNEASPRNYFLTFEGSQRENSPRVALTQLHDPANGVITLFRSPYKQQFPNMPYTDMLKQSQFAASVGSHQNIRSTYRFTEIMAAGAIPVIFADDWVLPFRPELVDWSECAVRIPEDRVSETVSILKRISPERQCRMRKRCFEIYTKYMATPKDTLNAVLEGLELVAEKNNV